MPGCSTRLIFECQNQPKPFSFFLFLHPTLFHPLSHISYFTWLQTTFFSQANVRTLGFLFLYDSRKGWSRNSGAVCYTSLENVPKNLEARKLLARYTAAFTRLSIYKYIYIPRLIKSSSNLTRPNF